MKMTRRQAYLVPEGKRVPASGLGVSHNKIAFILS